MHYASLVVYVFSILYFPCVGRMSGDLSFVICHFPVVVCCAMLEWIWGIKHHSFECCQ